MATPGPVSSRRNVGEPASQGTGGVNLRSLRHLSLLSAPAPGTSPPGRSLRHVSLGASAAAYLRVLQSPRHQLIAGWLFASPATSTQEVPVRAYLTSPAIREVSSCGARKLSLQPIPVTASLDMDVGVSEWCGPDVRTVDGRAAEPPWSD